MQRFTAKRILLVLLGAIALVCILDFGLASFVRNRMPEPYQVAALPPAMNAVFSDAISGDPSRVAQAAEAVYEQSTTPDELTQTGFRDLCLAEKLRRRAVELGHLPSATWLQEYYETPNFPIFGGQSYTSKADADAWRDWQPGTPIPNKAFSFFQSTYLWENSCTMSMIRTTEQQRILSAAIINGETSPR